MANTDIFKDDFVALAKNGVIGAEDGKLAFAYMRVSTSGQAEEGRSGLPRQISRIHEVAKEKGYCIPWDYVFADDSSGFEFQDRKNLQRLLTEIRKVERRADAVVMEYLDRLSRQSDWHQGYLLEQLANAKMEVIFWKPFTSRIERVFFGAMSQDSMERSKNIMAWGKHNKAVKGKITASRPAYGYIFVDSDGKEGVTARRDRNYAINEEEAPAVRAMFDKIANEGMPLMQVANYMNDHRDIYPAPSGNQRLKNGSGVWSMRTIHLIVRNPLYKGEYIANRWLFKKRPKVTGRPAVALLDTEARENTIYKIQRPKEEWIIIPAPAIVSEEIWGMANRILDRNKQTAFRNGKTQYLLTGLVKCVCGSSYSGNTSTHHYKKHSRSYRYYSCTSKARPKVIRDEIGCHQGIINADLLEEVIWYVVSQTLTDPSLLIRVLNNEAQSAANRQLEEQIAYLEKEITAKKKEDDKLYKAFTADVFDEFEYKERRAILKDEDLKLRQELHILKGKVITAEEIEASKRMVLELAEHARKRSLNANTPFEMKQRIMKTLIDKVVLNVEEGWFSLEGVLQGTWMLPGNDCSESEGAEHKIVFTSSR